MKSTFKKLQSIYDYIVLNVDSHSQTKRPAQVDHWYNKSFHQSSSGNEKVENIIYMI